MTHLRSGRLRPVFFNALSVLTSTLFFLGPTVQAEPLVYQPLIQNAQASQLERITLKLASQTIEVEVADTEPTRSLGLMFRTHLPANEGMLFVFDAPHRPCFWMKNTYIPLSIAFITDTGRIASIHDMHAESTDTHCPTQPILYALEMNQGWFQRHRITVGEKIIGLPNQID